MEGKKYWDNICKIQQAQTDKGISKYGQILEQNENLDIVERLTYLEEELVDGLMYLEHIKNYVRVDLGANLYQKLALRTANSVDADKLLLNGALGLSGEAGEVADHLKKHLFQGHELDKEHVAEELGDLCWYIAVAAKAIGYPLSEIMNRNVAKLQKRYPEGFDKERSINREV